MKSKTTRAYCGIVISDLHNGAFDSKRWYQELKDNFLNKIRNYIFIDFIVITGDFFDTKISLNSDHAKYAMKFLLDLLKICESKNCKLRIIKGTESHDNKQLEMFDTIIGMTNCDFKVIHTVEKEYLVDDIKVLYIPEEYMDNKDEFYKDYFSETYDFIFGHGLIDKAVFVAHLQESELTRSQAPIFKVEKLLNICKGPIYFGHIHKPMKYERFRYVGSFSRWSFGETEDKGFITVLYFPDKGEYYEEFIVNKDARKYDSLKINYSSKFFYKDEKEKVEYLLNMAKNFVVDYLRLEIDIPENYPNPNLLISLLNETFGKYSKIKLKINNSSKVKQKKEIEEKINHLLDKYGFIFDKSKSPEEKISKYIEIKYGRNINVERVRSYLYDELTTGRR